MKDHDVCNLVSSSSTKKKKKKIVHLHTDILYFCMDTHREQVQICGQMFTTGEYR